MLNVVYCLFLFIIKIIMIDIYIYIYYNLYMYINLFFLWDIGELIYYFVMHNVNMLVGCVNVFN